MTEVQTTSQAPWMDAEQLKEFHKAHFPAQDLPETLSSISHEVEEDQDGLGYYADGVKRTLTDEQIKMFRHSEIQRLLAERRQGQTQKREEKVKHRKQVQRAGRPVRFDDEPDQRNGNVDVLVYDDEDAAAPDGEEKSAGEGKFRWPILGGKT